MDEILGGGINLNN